MEMVMTLERSIPQSEVKRIFSDFIQTHEDWLVAENKKNQIEADLLRREKEM